MKMEDMRRQARQEEGMKEEYGNKDSLCWRGPPAIYPTDPPLVEDEAQFKNTQKSWKEKEYGHGSRWGPKARLTVLARASSNLPDRPNKGDRK
jgi:hypothetical protein